MNDKSKLSDLYGRFMWVWCRIAYHVYMNLPTSMSHRTIYGRLMLWSLGFAGLYAHSKDYADFIRSPYFK